MTMAMMITSSPEDLSNISTTIKMINLVENMLGDHATYLEYGDAKLTKDELEHISDYFSTMRYILTNPGMTEEELNQYEQTRED